MKKLSLFLYLMFGCISLFAQRQQISVDYMNPVFQELPFNMHGKMTYNYIVDENGGNTKDGPLTVNCKVNQKYKGWANGHYNVITVVGQSTINAIYKKGDLNGAITSNYKATSNDGVKSETYSATMSGRFTEGVPDGSFVVKRSAGIKSTLNATYKNGVLVGAYSCSLLDDDSHVIEMSGTLLQSGLPTGIWNLNGTKATFQNGILISVSTSKYSTRPAVVELAKQYAAGTITKEELAEKNIIVNERTMKLGDYARIAIFRDSGVEFEDLGGYDFTISNNIKYEELEELVSLTDTGAELLAQQVTKLLTSGRVDLDEAIFYDFGATDKYGCLYYEKKYNLYYICMTKERQTQYLNSKYIIGTARSNTEHVYLSPKQLELVDSVADEFYVQRPRTFASVVYDCISSEKSSSSALGYLKGNRDYKLETLKEIKKEINAAYQKFLKESTPHKSNESIVLWQWKNSKPMAYVAKSSIEPFLSELEENIAKAEGEFKATIVPLFEFIVANKKASNIAYDTNLEKYFVCKKSTDYWRLEVSNVLKPFCPVIGYEILDITENSVKCRLVKKGKKDTTQTYEIEVKYENEYGNPRLVVESFDINNAKLVEE